MRSWRELLAWGRRRPWTALPWLAALLSCASAQNDASLYRAIVGQSGRCGRTAAGLRAADAELTDAAAAQSMTDLRACMRLIYRPEALEPVLQCMAEASCDADCPPAPLQLAPLPAHREVGTACTSALQRCKGNVAACDSVVHALLMLTDAVAEDVRRCFQGPCGELEACVTTLPGIAGGVRVAGCMMKRERQLTR